MRIYCPFCQFVLLNGLVVSIERDKINNNSETIIVSVKDPGQGIDSAILPRLFTKYASKSYKGTGLGLFISKGIIEAHFYMCHHTCWSNKHRCKFNLIFEFLFYCLS